MYVDGVGLSPQLFTNYLLFCVVSAMLVLVYGMKTSLLPSVFFKYLKSSWNDKTGKL